VVGKFVERDVRYSRDFLVCSTTQKCSSKEICTVLLSKMCSRQLDNISLENSKFLVLKYIFQEMQICYIVNK